MNDIERTIEHYKTQNKFCEGRDSFKDELECNTLAIEALEKQIPEAPIIMSGSYHCPECSAEIQVGQKVGRFAVTADKFCRNCGQALEKVEI